MPVMCGRYRLKDPKKAFGWLEVVPAFDFLPRFNIAPSQRVPVVAAAGRVEEMVWGIVPAWAATSQALINARSESVREKRSFKASFRERRCLMPADGFYEWSKIGKRPHFFAVNDGAPFAIGGIWERGADLSRCCLLTTAANEVLKPIHDRMPVIVRRKDWEEWLAPGELSDPEFQRIATPYRADEMSAIPVSPRVNNARVDDPACCEEESAAPEVTAVLKIAREEPGKADQETFRF
jgi:putative SOS response-associated peptidase YedK